MMDDRSALARQWLDRADETDRHIAEYDPSEKDLPEVGMMEVEAETLRRCARELYALTPSPVLEEIKF